MKKTIATGLLALILPLTSFADYYIAGEPGSRPSEDIKISPATVDSVTTLVNKTTEGADYRNLQVKVIVQSSGGSTDVSPQKRVYLGLYSENEMFDLVGTYDIGSAFTVTSVTRVEGGIYKITGELVDFRKPITIIIDAVDAVNELKTMSCGEFDRCQTTKAIKVIKK